MTLPHTFSTSKFRMHQAARITTAATLAAAKEKKDEPLKPALDANDFRA